MDRILIDANSLGHAALQGTVLKAGDQETQAVYGVVKAIRALRVRHPDAQITTLWDGFSWRKKVSAVYKANRVATPEKVAERKRYSAQTPYIRRALTHLGMPQVAASNMEADDLAAILSRRFIAKGDFVKLISGDRDWLQLVGPNCIWEDHRDATRLVNHKSFEKATGFPTIAQFVQSKALQGDTSDNLPGVGGLGELRATALLKVWGRVEAFWADPDPQQTWTSKGGSGKIPKAMLDFHHDPDKHARFCENFKLMNLCGELPEPERLTLSKGSFDPNSFKSLCHELGFSSIYRPEAFGNWVEPFSRTVH